MANDHREIEQTLARYCHRVDRGTAKEVAALFAQDAILSPYYDGPYEVYGREGIRGWYAFYHQTLGANVTNLKHLINSMMIDVDGDVATSVCYLTAYFTSKEDKTAYQTQGTYYDTLVREGDTWLFQTRRIEVEFITSLGTVIDQMKPMGFPGSSG
ncbi:MAG: nuclear transport factor 2 family protein [Proteobacteria bacterium]|nr:nuclear transport factor 2 family protein [Pseudomonadota bacterium]